MRDLLGAYRRACSETIERYGGWVSQYQGDGVVAYFGYPKAQEDDAVRAIHAAIEIVPKVHSILEKTNVEADTPLTVRIAVDTGTVVAGELQSGKTGESMSVVGNPPNIASRVQALAAPGQVVITERTMRLVEGRFETEDLGLHELRGISDPLRLFQVRKASENVTRFEAVKRLTPFINRETELNAIQDQWQQARIGHGKVILISGEPGIGKSRLIQEIRSKIGHDPHMWLRFPCSPYFTQSAFFPVIVGMKRALGINDSDDATLKRKKLHSFIGRDRSLPQNSEPTFTQLLDIEPEHTQSIEKVTSEQQRRNTFQTLLQTIELKSQNLPLILVVEDAHWIDPTTSEFIDNLVQIVNTNSILLAITYRPNFQLQWNLGFGALHLVLGRLDPEHSQRLANSILGEALFSVDLRDRVVERSDGIPLYIEELTKSAAESLISDDARSSSSSSLHGLGAEVPATLKGAILARLDNFPQSRDVLQHASVIGRHFESNVLAEMLAWEPARLEDELTILERHGFIFRVSAAEPTSCNFEHMLFRDVIYDSILRRDRRELHAKLADILRTNKLVPVKQQSELLAFHYTAAGQTVEAIESWLDAGLKANKRSESKEALAHLNAGLELIPQLTKTRSRTALEAKLQTTLGAALRARDGFAAPGVVEAFERARKLCNDIDETDLLLDVLPGLQSYYHVKGQLRTARELAQNLVSTAKTRPEETYRLLDAERRLGWAQFWSGDIVEANQTLSRAISLYDPAEQELYLRLHGDHPGILAHCNLAWTKWCNGFAAEAEHHTETAITMTSEVNHIPSSCYTNCVIAALFAIKGDASAAKRLAEGAIAIAEEIGFPYWAAWAHVISGWAKAQLDEIADGSDELQKGIVAYADTGARLFIPLAAILEVQVRRLSGSDAKYDRLDNQGDPPPIGKEAGVFDAELLRQQALSLLASGKQFHIAEPLFERAIDIANKQNAYFFELRAATDLASHCLTGMQRQSAMTMLLEIRQRSPQHLLQPDLQRADHLLSRENTEE